MEIKSITNSGFTLIEILVVLGISVILITVVGGVMNSSFRAKINTESLELVSSEAQVVMSQLKKNILDADTENIFCPLAIGSSISFMTKSSGMTTLFCDQITNKIASISAQSGSFRLTNNGISVQNCNNFVTCQTNSVAEVISVDFNINIGVTGGALGNQFWQFLNKVTLR